MLFYLLHLDNASNKCHIIENIVKALKFPAKVRN